LLLCIEILYANSPFKTAIHEKGKIVMKTDKTTAPTTMRNVVVTPPKVVSDNGRVRMGDGGGAPVKRILVTPPKQVADTGRVRIGNGGGAPVKRN
jgi:hypothetical protein